MFIGVYGENEKRVREFLASKGKDIAIRVAANPKGEMWRSWCEPVCLEGIPQAFIVGKDGKIAWIGHPANLAEPLGQIVAGTFDPQEHILRLKVEQEAFLRLRRDDERLKKAFEENNRILDIMNAADALAATEKKTAEYRDCPRATEYLRNACMYRMAKVPGRQEEAFKLATELAIEAKMSGRYVVMLNLAKWLLSLAAGTEPEARDKRFIDLALPLLSVPPHDPDLRRQPDKVLQDYQVNILQFRGYAVLLAH